MNRNFFKNLACIKITTFEDEKIQFAVTWNDKHFVEFSISSGICIPLIPEVPRIAVEVCGKLQYLSIKNENIHLCPKISLDCFDGIGNIKYHLGCINFGPKGVSYAWEVGNETN